MNKILMCINVCKKEDYNLSPCFGLLRHFVKKFSPFGVNVPHNDSPFLHVITRKKAEQSENLLEQSDVVILNTAHQCHPKTLTRISKLTSFIKKFNPLTEREGKNNVIESESEAIQPIVINNSPNCKMDNKKVKNLLPYSLNALLLQKKLAFTLAEVLITLGIIGIVAAMTIPTLITSYQKEVTVQRLKQMYSIINQAAKMYTNDTEAEFGSFDTQLTPKEFFEKYFSSYLKVVQTCEPASECYKNETPVAVDRKTQIDLPPYMVALLNGTFVGYFSHAGGTVFYVDINGKSKPNRSGRDIFYFYLFNPDTIGKFPGCSAQLNSMKQNFKSGLYPGGFASCFLPLTSYKRNQLLNSNSGVHRTCSLNIKKLMVEVPEMLAQP